MIWNLVVFTWSQPKRWRGSDVSVWFLRWKLPWSDLEKKKKKRGLPSSHSFPMWKWSPCSADLGISAVITRCEVKYFHEPEKSSPWYWMWKSFRSTNRNEYSSTGFCNLLVFRQTMFLSACWTFSLHFFFLCWIIKTSNYIRPKPSCNESWCLMVRLPPALVFSCCFRFLQEASSFWRECQS